MSNPSEIVQEPEIESAKRSATIVYALQAAAFLLAVTFIAAIIVNYVKNRDIENTWVASHFRWQVRTFWFGALWFIFGLITLIMGIGYFILMGTAVWVIYRIAKGWLALMDNKPMYLDE